MLKTITDCNIVLHDQHHVGCQATGRSVLVSVKEPDDEIDESLDIYLTEDQARSMYGKLKDIFITNK